MGAGNNATVRFSRVSGGTPTVAIVDTDLPAPRADWLSSSAFDRRTNWAPNGQYSAWASGVQVRDWTATGGITVAPSATHETGTQSVAITYAASTGALTAMPVLMPSTVVSPGGGTQTWRAGCRYQIVSGPGGGILMQRSIDGGSSWSSVGSIVTGAGWQTTETTFTTSASSQPPILRFARNASSGVVLIDRVWLFRDGVDDGDDTVIGNGPAAAFYSAQRELLRARVAATVHEVGIADRYRDDPTGFPGDNLAVGQQARLVIPSRGLDVTLPITQLVIDELRLLATTAQFGGLRRRLSAEAG